MALLPLEDIFIFTLNWLNHFNICMATFCWFCHPGLNSVKAQRLLTFDLGQL